MHYIISSGKFTNSDLAKLAMKNANSTSLETVLALQQALIKHLKLGSTLAVSAVNEVTIVCSKFLTKFQRIRNEDSFRYDTFIQKEKYQQFLDEAYIVKPSNAGRPKPHFTHLSDKSKKRRYDDLESTFTPETIDNYVYDYIETSKSSRALFQALDRQTVPIDTAIAIITILKMSVREYQNLKILLDDYLEFPSYYAILRYKKTKIYLNIVTSENSVKCNLKDLIENTINDYFQLIKSVNGFNLRDRSTPIEVLFKWGADGCTNLTQIKHKRTNDATNDQSLFTCMVAFLQFSQNGKVLYRVENPSSPYHCRPVEMYAQKETNELTLSVKESIDSQIQDMDKMSFMHEDKIYTFKPVFICSMVDGKTINAFEDIKWTQMCHICLKGGKQLEVITPGSTQIQDASKYEHPASLHALLRSLDFLLKLAYKLPNVDIENKAERVEAEKNTKKFIHDEVYSNLGLNIDMPYQQAGNTNDGNTARKIYENVDFFSGISGIDREFITKLSNLIACLSSTKQICPEKYLEEAKKCFEIWHTKYSSFKSLSPTIHKVLVHGHEYLKIHDIPIGYLSEQCLESCNKIIKQSREHHTSKISRESIMKDHFNYLLTQSWPYIIKYSSQLSNARKSNSFADINEFLSG